MRVLMLSWEYPPRIVGGLSRHVDGLSRSLSSMRVNVTVLTVEHPEAPKRETVNGVRVVRCDSFRFFSPDFISWVHQFNVWMLEEALKIASKRPPDIIHAHDWLVTPTAVALKHLFRRPLIATIHSTEMGRRGGIHSELQRHIHMMEWWLTFEAWRVIVCSSFMKREVIHAFGLPEDKVDVLPNAVTPFEGGLRNVRDKYAGRDEHLILFVGRMVPEKGPHILFEAAKRVLKRRWDVKFVFVGEGPLREKLMKEAEATPFPEKFYFTGFLPDDELKSLYVACDLAVFPSLYEPFGIVALEAMSVGKPVVASDVGGFSEMIEDGVTGVKVRPGDAEELASAIERLVEDAELRRALGEAGMRVVRERFSWKVVAEKVLRIYRRVLSEYRRGTWKPVMPGEVPSKPRPSSRRTGSR